MNTDYFVSNDGTMMHYNLRFFCQGHILRVNVASHRNFSEKIFLRVRALYYFNYHTVDIS